MKKHFFSLAIVSLIALTLTGCLGPVLLGGGVYLGYRGSAYSGIKAETNYVSSSSLSGGSQTTIKTTSTLYKINWNGKPEITYTVQGEQTRQTVQLKDLLGITIDNAGQDSLEATVTDKKGTARKVTLAYQKGNNLEAVIDRNKKILIPLENIISLKSIAETSFYNHMFQE